MNLKQSKFRLERYYKQDPESPKRFWCTAGGQLLSLQTGPSHDYQERQDRHTSKWIRCVGNKDMDPHLTLKYDRWLKGGKENNR